MFTSKPFIDWASKLAAVYRQSRDRFLKRGDDSEKERLTDEVIARGFEQKRNWNIRDKLRRT